MGPQRLCRKSAKPVSLPVLHIKSMTAQQCFVHWLELKSQTFLDLKLTSAFNDVLEHTALIGNHYDTSHTNGCQPF